MQGCLLDWPTIKATLLESVDDLLPPADLQPAEKVTPRQEAFMLAALPVRLVPPTAPPQAVPGGTANHPPVDAVIASGQPAAEWPVAWVSLAVAWVCVLLAALAVGRLLLGVMRLSERRAAFVTAVTHELRTPLTTFQMYAEMSAEGWFAIPNRRRSCI